MSTFDKHHGPSASKMAAIAGRFLTGDGKPWFVMIGTTGAGKTHLATAITLGLCAQGVAARYETADDFLEKMRDSETGTIRHDEDAVVPASHRMATYTLAPVLVLDDIRADQITTQWQAKVLDTLVDARYRTGAPSVWTTNCSEEELGERMGRRLLRDPELAEVLYVQGRGKQERRAA